MPLGSQVVDQGRELRAERRQRVAVPLVLSLNGGDQRDDVLGHWLVGPELDDEVMRMTDMGLQSRRINSVYGLINLVRSSGDLASVVEIGSFRGVSTEVLLLVAAQVYAVDPWTGMEAICAKFVDRSWSYPDLEGSRPRRGLRGAP